MHGHSPDTSSCQLVEVVEFACGIASELKGELVENVSTGMDTYSIRQPLGVCSFSHYAIVQAAAKWSCCACTFAFVHLAELMSYCAIGRCRHLPLQFPSNGAAMDVAIGHRCRQYICAQTF